MSLIVLLAASLIVGGDFENGGSLPSDAFRPSDGGLELFTEDLSWNKCAKLIAGPIHDETSGGHPIKVSSANLHIGGTSGIPVEPDMYYDFSFELKGSIETVIARVYELSEKDGKATRKSAMKDQYFAPGKDWRRYSLRYHSGPDVRRVELCLLVWSMEGNGQESFAPGDFVLIDNVAFSRSERYAKLQESLRTSRDAVRVAPYPVETDPACPFLPLELAEPPDEIVFRAAVNEKKSLPVAVGNMTDAFAQYRVVLETEPGEERVRGVRLDNGEFGLEGYPKEKIAVREALRFKDTEEDPVTTRLDPLVGLNEASVISVPPHEAGAVWFDFDTYGVKPGTYRGRLRVIPLNAGSAYAVKDGRTVRGRTGERIVPVAFTVDPIVLPREAVRPAHFCSTCQSEQGFALESDIGARIYALGTSLVRPEAVGNPDSAFRRTVDEYRAWARNRGVKITFFVKYDALNVSQTIFNPKKDPDRKWPAWEEYVKTLATLADEAGLSFEDYYVLVRDEPANDELETVREAQRRLKRLYPKMRTYISACERINGPVDYLEFLGDTTDLWSLTSRMYDRKTTARLRALKGKYGTKLLHYLCNTSVRESLSGYFRRHCWRGECWGLDADMLYQFNIYNPGLCGEWSLKVVPKGEISYKVGDRFLPSVRYMAYREGVTDVKYVQALRDACRGDEKTLKWLDEAVERVMSSSAPELPAQVRKEIREKLLANGVVAHRLRRRSRDGELELPRRRQGRPVFLNAEMAMGEKTDLGD